MSVTTSIRTALAAALLVAASSPALADGGALVHVDSIYRDSRGKALSSPEGVACGKRGAVVVADTGNKRLLRFQIAKGQVTGGAPIGSRKIDYPVRVHMTSTGETLALDLRNKKIARLDKNGSFSGHVKLTGAGDEVVPVSFALDSSDNLYVLDVAARRVVVASPQGAYKRQIALPKDAKTITDIAVASDGAVYAIGGAKPILYKASKGDKSFSSVGKELSATLTYVTHLALSATRASLIAVDQHGNGIVWLGLDGSVLGRRLGMGQRDGFVYYPSQACETSGYLVVADRGNDRVQVFSTSK